jgi:hypothetical protein
VSPACKGGGDTDPGYDHGFASAERT